MPLYPAIVFTTVLVSSTIRTLWLTDAAFYSLQAFSRPLYRILLTSFIPVTFASTAAIGMAMHDHLMQGKTVSTRHQVAMRLLLCVVGTVFTVDVIATFTAALTWQEYFSSTYFSVGDSLTLRRWTTTLLTGQFRAAVLFPDEHPRLGPVHEVREHGVDGTVEEHDDLDAGTDPQPTIRKTCGHLRRDRHRRPRVPGRVHHPEHAKRIVLYPAVHAGDHAERHPVLYVHQRFPHAFQHRPRRQPGVHATILRARVVDER